MFFKINVPHVLEKIFLSLDYESYKTCLEVSNDWRELLTSESYQRKAKDLFQEEITEDEQKLWDAAWTGNIENITRLLSSGMLDVNSIPEDYNSTPLFPKGYNHDSTPLHMASSRGHLNVVELLLKIGAQHDSRNRSGRTPLHEAARCGQKDVVKLLIDYGTDVDIKYDNGETPLSCAANRGHMDTVQLLLKMGADPNARSRRGETPLDQATRRRHRDVVQTLLKYTR